MDTRRKTLQSICLGCHSTPWVNGRWRRLENSIHETNAKTLSATNIMTRIWRLNLANFKYGDKGPKGDPFDEAVERKWSKTWLIYGNHIRFASAMGCGGDYGVFSEGRYDLARTIFEIQDWLELKKSYIISSARTKNRVFR